VQLRALLLPYFHTEPIRLALARICREEGIELHVDQAKPSQVAEQWLEQYDIVQVPAVLVRKFREHYHLSRVVIAARGPVLSVAIFHVCDIDICAVDSLYVTSESIVSRTLLLKLLQHLCGHCPRVTIVDVDLCNLEQLVRARPTLLIGDLALIAATRFRAVLDLGELWARLLNKPLVFAVLMYRRGGRAGEIVQKLEQELNQRESLAKHVYLSNHWVKHFVPLDLLLRYVLENIVYLLDLREIESSVEVITQLLSQTLSR